MVGRSSRTRDAAGATSSPGIWSRAVIPRKRWSKPPALPARISGRRASKRRRPRSDPSAPTSFHARRVLVVGEPSVTT